MRRFMAIAVAALLLAACSGSDNQTPNVEASVNPANDKIPFKQLTIKWNGGLSSDITLKLVSLNSDRLISANISRYEVGKGDIGSCANSAPLKEEVYQAILDAVTAADLAKYQPPAEGGPTCKIPGQSGIQVVYVQQDDTENRFSTGTCEIEDAINSLATVLNDAAVDAIPSCTEEKVGSSGSVSPAPAQDNTANSANTDNQIPVGGGNVGTGNANNQDNASGNNVGGTASGNNVETGGNEVKEPATEERVLAPTVSVTHVPRLLD